ncbi:MAG: hypothetical protein WDN30_02755 [Pararobbsia sp.]
MDWHEGLQLYGQHGSVIAKTYNPWYFKSSDVDIFSERDASWRRPLGADGHFYRVSSKALPIRFSTVRRSGARRSTTEIASVRAMVATRAVGRHRKARQTRRRRGEIVMTPGVFARTYAARYPGELFDRVREDGFSAVQFNLSCAGLAPLPAELPAGIGKRIAAGAGRSGDRALRVGPAPTTWPTPIRRIADATDRLCQCDAGRKRYGCAACDALYRFARRLEYVACPS